MAEFCINRTRKPTSLMDWKMADRPGSAMKLKSFELMLNKI
jgi:hypothetical protein